MPSTFRYVAPYSDIRNVVGLWVFGNHFRVLTAAEEDVLCMAYGSGSVNHAVS